MLQIRRILFPTDFTRCAHQALEHALHLAKDCRAELHMLHAVVLHGLMHESPHYPFAEVEEIERRLENTAIDRMQSMLDERTDTTKLSVKKVRRRGISAAPVILDYARDQDIDLIVMGTHGRRGLGHLFLGSVAEEVVRLAPCAVLTVREGRESKPTRAVERILVPVDFSTHSQRAISHARALAITYNARLQLLHVVERRVYPSFYALERDSFFDVMKEAAEVCLQNLQRTFKESNGPSVSAEFRLIEGHAATDIADFAADNDTDLIVIATHGLTGIEHLFLGGVTEKVVRRATCPVFVVKTFGRRLIYEN